MIKKLDSLATLQAQCTSRELFDIISDIRFRKEVRKGNGYMERVASMTRSEFPMLIDGTGWQVFTWGEKVANCLKGSKYEKLFFLVGSNLEGEFEETHDSLDYAIDSGFSLISDSVNFNQ